MCVSSSLSCVSLFENPWNVPTRLLCPWNSPGKNTEVCCHSFSFKKKVFILIEGWLLYNTVVGFAIHWHKSAMGVHVFPILKPPPPPSPSHRSGSSQCTSTEHPVLCIELGLVICFTYDNMHVSMLFSHHPTLAFSHTVQNTVLYICVSFAVSHTGLSLSF